MGRTRCSQCDSIAGMQTTWQLQIFQQIAFSSTNVIAYRQIASIGDVSPEFINSKTCSRDAAGSSDHFDKIAAI